VQLEVRDADPLSDLVIELGDLDGVLSVHAADAD
jgi:hypothetical protein